MRKNPSVVAAVALAVATAFGTGCILEQEWPAVHQAVERAEGPDVSLVRLIGNPEHYDGMRVRVEGFCSLEFEGTAVYLHRDDYENLLFKNALWLEFTPRPRGPRDPHGQYCLVEGTFDPKHTGHLNAFSGALKKLTRLEASLSREQLRKGSK